MRTHANIAAIMLATATAAGHGAPADADREIDVIAFGSCARETRPQPVWDDIALHQPDLFLFIGDNQYADVHYENGKRVMRPVTDIARLEEAYADLAAKPGWSLINQTSTVLATWDDHDYGANDAGADYPLRAESQRVFMDFYRIPDDHPMRAQEGVYQARVFGPQGRRVQVILLDTRYHRDPIDRNPLGRVNGLGPYIPTDDASRTILGEAQWDWLETQLRQPADVRIIASSIQVVADQHGWETWGNMPHERQRLYRLIDETDAAGVIFLSGDRHLTELSRHPVGAHDAPYPMWDFTSSGMTEEGERPARDPNDHRVGPVRRITNFGIVRIDWADTHDQTAIHFEARGENDTLLNRQTIFLGELSE